MRVRDYLRPSRFNPACRLDSFNNRKAKIATRDAGFSLLEVLAVLVIIGLMSAAVVVSMRGPDTSEQDFADNFVLQLNRLAKESIYTGRINALSVSEEGLHLMSYVNREWITLEEFSFESTISAELFIEDETVDIPKEPAPLILFEPTGEVTDFVLTVDGLGTDLSLFRNDDGAIQIGEPS